METRLYRQKQRISLIQVEPGVKPADSNVLAAMTLYEGTGCWQVVDIRLSQYRTPSPYSGSLVSDDVYASITPENEDEAEFIKSQLREYTVDDKGAIHCCPFNGRVRGRMDIPGRVIDDRMKKSGAGFFTMDEGLAELLKIQAFWTYHTGDFESARQPNPHAQPSETVMFARVWARQDIDFTAFFEPDFGMGFSAIATRPLEQHERRYLSSWKLLRMGSR